ncbi:MAG: hypothetical protein ACE5F1_07105 [Planctomycetota bacterium]
MTRGREQGAALVFALALVIFVGSMTTLIVARARSDAHASVLERGRLRAFYAAEGGLEQARHRLRSDSRYRGEDLEIGGCPTEIRVRASGSLSWRVTIRSRCPAFGQLGAAVRSRIEAALVRGRSLPSVRSWRELD